MFNSKVYILSIAILFLIASLTSIAKDSISKFLPKTNNTTTENKDSEKEDESDDELEDEEDEVNNPDENFKLIAIYQVANKPRALIKDLANPEDSAKEYQVGDYLGEIQAFSISKILFNPTPRIELIDVNGLSYVIKPKNSDSPNSASAASMSSKPLPTYFSGGKTKIKRATATSTETPAASPKATEKKEEGNLESAIKNDSASPSAASAPTQASTPPPQPQNQAPPTQQQEPSSATAQPSSATAQPSSNPSGQTQPSTSDTTSMTDSMADGATPMEDTRPSNPFGE